MKNFEQSNFFEHALKGKQGFTLKIFLCDFTRMQRKDTFDNHIPTYFSLKVSRYFIFRCLVTPYYRIFVSSNYLKIRYFKKKSSPSISKHLTSIYLPEYLENGLFAKSYPATFYVELQRLKPNNWVSIALRGSHQMIS